MYRMIAIQDKKAIDLLPSASDWEHLSMMTEKRNAFSSDLYFRECWADMAQVFGARVTGTLGSIAVLNVKPDAVVGRRMTSILKFVVNSGFLPVAVAPLRLTRHSMRELWRYDWHVYPVDRLAFSTVWYTSTEILVFVLQDLRPQGFVPASVRLSQLKGSAVPEKRTPTNLRTVLRPPNRILNFVHVAEEPADIVRELGIFFDRPERISLLTQIEENAGVNRCDAVLEDIARLEARYPEHDLDLDSSLLRLEKSPHVTSATLAHIRKLLGTGAQLSWDELCSILDPATKNIDRWDFICVASNLLRIEREVFSHILPNVDINKWDTPESDPAACVAARLEPR